MKSSLLLLLLFALCLIPCLAQQNDEQNQLYPVAIDGRYGYINRQGEMVIKPQFDRANKFHDGLALVTINGKDISTTKGHYDFIGGDDGYIDKTGKFVIKPGTYSIANDFSEGLAAVSIQQSKSKSHHGYIDTTGKIVIPAQFQNATEFHNGTAGVRIDNDKWGVIDKTGKFIIKPNYEEVMPFIEDIGIASIIKNKKSSPLDQKISDFESIFFDRKGTVIAHIPRFVFGWFTDGLISFFDETKGWGFLDKSGRIAIEPRFEKIGYFSEGLCNIRIGNRWGYIDTTGNYIVQPYLNDAFPFLDGLGKVIINGKTGFIDKTGKFVIQPQEWDVDNFEDGLAYARRGDERGLIDKTGKFIWKIKY